MKETKDIYSVLDDMVNSKTIETDTKKQDFEAKDKAFMINQMNRGDNKYRNKMKEAYTKKYGVLE